MMDTEHRWDDRAGSPDASRGVSAAGVVPTAEISSKLANVQSLQMQIMMTFTENVML